MGKGASAYDLNKLEAVSTIIFMEHGVGTRLETSAVTVPYLTRRHGLMTNYSKGELTTILTSTRNKSGMEDTSWADLRRLAIAWTIGTELKLAAQLSRLTARELAANTSTVKPHDEQVRELVAQLARALGMLTTAGAVVDSDIDVIMYLKACIRTVTHKTANAVASSIGYKP